MGNIEFAIIDTKSQFEDKVSSIPDTWVVFIKDTKQIWTHGLYFGVTNDDEFNSLINKVSNIEDILKGIGTSDYVKQSHETLTQDEYNNRLANGLIFDDVFYYIVEND